MKEKLAVMKVGGARLVKILTSLEKMTKPGINLLEIEREARILIKKAGGEPSFLKVPGYRHATCLNVNDGLVHGIPKDYQLREDDLLNIDIGFFYKGFHTDLAKSLIVTNQRKKYPEKRVFLEAGKKALEQAIKVAQEGNFVGHISAKIQQIIEDAGCNCAKKYTGHGIGRDLHQPPIIPCILTEKIERTPTLSFGMTLAIEVIYMRGRGETRIGDDDWTVKTADGSWGACFEKTIAVGRKKPIILTSWPS